MGVPIFQWLCWFVIVAYINVQEFIPKCRPPAHTRTMAPLLTGTTKPLSADKALEILKTSIYYNGLEDFIAAEGGSVFLFKPETPLDQGGISHEICELLLLILYTLEYFLQSSSGSFSRPRSDSQAIIVRKYARLITNVKTSGDGRFRQYSWTDAG